MQMFWKGDKIVDLSRAFLDTNGCSKSQEVKITHLEEVKEETKSFHSRKLPEHLKR